MKQCKDCWRDGGCRDGSRCSKRKVHELTDTEVSILKRLEAIIHESDRMERNYTLGECLGFMKGSLKMLIAQIEGGTLSS